MKKMRDIYIERVLEIVNSDDSIETLLTAPDGQVAIKVIGSNLGDVSRVIIAVKRVNGEFVTYFADVDDFGLYSGHYFDTERSAIEDFRDRK